MKQILPAFWNSTASDLLDALESSRDGLTGSEAKKRLKSAGANRLKQKTHANACALLFSQFKSPIILILFFATSLSFALGDTVDAFIILAIILVSGLLGFTQERGAKNAVERLLSIVRINSSVLRDGVAVELPVDDIVPGDIVMLKAGDVIPGDALIVSSRELFVDEAMLTGETFPVEKSAGVLAVGTRLGGRTNSLLMGTHVVSGIATALTVFTGRDTEFGKVSDRLRLRPEETEFERGIRRFGNFLMEVTLVLVVAIFAINVFLARPVLDSFLFSLALAVGLTPQLLPAIISINLSHGARRMAEKKVIIKHLPSIENFGSMNVLCSDKTGTLTEGVVQVKSGLDVDGAPSEKVLLHAFLNASFETGFTNPIDKAIRDYRKLDISGYEKAYEIPYDFIRKRLSIVVCRDGKNVMVTKGALMNVLAVCTKIEKGDGTVDGIAGWADRIERDFEDLSGKGFRVLGVSYRNLDAGGKYGVEHESDMTFSGFLVLYDPPKAGIAETVAALKKLGVTLKIITGDNHLVAANVSQQIGFGKTRMLTGLELERLSDTALLNLVNDIDVFAEIEPNQKERIIIALKKSGSVVGYMGDGINDASALHAADVGISMDGAVDVAKDAADIVLLEKNLDVLVDGVREGRATFANTLKYVRMATSANFGNMFSMAGISLVLPFLPLLPKQILLMNLLTDIPEMTISADGVDAELIESPKRWSVREIRRFMVTFGLVSSVFDFLAFGALLLFLGASEIQFRTGWFLESVVSASLIVIVIRSRRPFFRSKPGILLLGATALVVCIAVLLTLTSIFQFCRLPALYFLVIGSIVAMYIVVAEIAKKLFYGKNKS